MGACQFTEFASAKTAREAFDALVADISDYIDVDDPYNGTMAACDLSSDEPERIAETWTADVAKRAVEFAKSRGWGEKWYAHALDCGRDTDNPGAHVWAFYGLAGT